jgi:hypothetical protein
MSDPASREDSPRNHFVPRFRPGRIREASYRDMAVRFAFGGTISVVAALIGAVTTESIGGGLYRLPRDTGGQPHADRQTRRPGACLLRRGGGCAGGGRLRRLRVVHLPHPGAVARSRIAWGGPFDLAGGERGALCALYPARLPGARRRRIRRQISPRTRPRDRRIRFGSILRRSGSFSEVRYPQATPKQHQR